MKIINQHSGNYEEIDRLIDRYYEGLTSSEEEKQLRNLLSRKDLPESYKPEQVIFGYFETKKQKRIFMLQPYLRWGTAVAAIVIMAFNLQVFMPTNASNYAFIDGKKTTNVDDIKMHALASLNNVSCDNEEVEKSFDSLNDKEIMKEQLDAFSGLAE